MFNSPISQRDEERLLRLLAESSKRIKLCILCDEPTRDRGASAFPPDVSDELGAPPGKRRLAVYPLCRRHELTDDEMIIIEARLKTSLAVDGIAVAADAAPVNASGSLTSWLPPDVGKPRWMKK